MNRSQLPAAAFIDPRGENRQEVERLTGRVLALLMPHLTTAAKGVPLPEARAHESSLPEAPLTEDKLLDGLRLLIADSMNIAHPGYIGHMNSMPTTISVLGDLVASALSNNMLFEELSPVFTPLEISLMKEFARLFGLGQAAGGVLLGSGTMANLQVLSVARNLRFGSLEKGIAAARKPPVLFASEAAHASVQKAAMLLGLGMDGVLAVETDEHSRMRPESLRDEIRRALARGQEPFCVIATAGTTVTGNIDPLVETEEIAREHGLWFHVDAAYGGGLIFSEKERSRLAGIERADSITFNPQKWLYVSQGCSMALFRNMEAMEQAFKVPSPYGGGARAASVNLGEVTVHGSRRVEVLKLWLSLQHLGRSGYGQLVEEACALAEYFLGKIDERPFLQVAGRPDMNILCFRATPERVPAELHDEWNTRLQMHLLRDEQVYFSLPPYRGARWLRTVLLNPYTDESLVERVFEAVDSFATDVH